MHVIVGLGNPGDEYRDSRHNAGFLVVAALARGSGIRLTAGRGDFLKGCGEVAGRAAALVLPLTYMNASGTAVLQALGEFGTGVGDLLVVCDDTCLPLGQLRLRRRGGDGGHKGLGSIIKSLGTKEFARLRIGVGAPKAELEMVGYVLGRFRDDEAPVVEEATRRAIEAIGTALVRGIDAAMNAYNRRTQATGEVHS